MLCCLARNQRWLPKHKRHVCLFKPAIQRAFLCLVFVPVETNKNPATLLQRGLGFYPWLTRSAWGLESRIQSRDRCRIS
jgi:hypothetical protein